MAVGQDEARIRVTVDSAKAREVMTDLDKEQKRLQQEEQRRKEERERQKSQEREELTRAATALARRPLQLRDRSRALVASGLGTVPLGGGLLRAGFETAAFAERFGAEFAAGIIETVIQDLDPKIAELVSAAVEDGLLGVTDALSEADSRLGALEKTAEAAFQFARSASLIGFDIDADQVEKFLSGSLKWHYSLEKLQKAGRNVAHRQMGKAISRQLKGVFGR